MSDTFIGICPPPPGSVFGDFSFAGATKGGSGSRALRCGGAKCWSLSLSLSGGDARRTRGVVGNKGLDLSFPTEALMPLGCDHPGSSGPGNIARSELLTLGGHRDTTSGSGASDLTSLTVTSMLVAPCHGKSRRKRKCTVLPGVPMMRGLTRSKGHR